MVHKFFLIAAVLLMTAYPGRLHAKDGYVRNPDIDVVHYCFKMFLNDTTDRIEGEAGITFYLTGNSRAIRLDLLGINSKGTGMTVRQVLSGRSQIAFSHNNNLIEISVPDSVKVPGTFSLTVYYEGIPADGLIISKNKFGDRTFFGDNWPDRARNWLPCVDHPSDKATVEFIVSAPEKYKVVSNGYLAAEFRDTLSGRLPVKVTHWKEDVPIPTKVMVIGVADFAWSTAGFSKGIPVQSWVYSENREAGFADYLPAPGILTFYQDLVGPYSYEKLANVQSKTKFGGMENSGCIFYYENSVKGNNQLHSLLAHEIAHQWFGDAVTENDWHHVWLSEGFATYLEAIYADSLIPDRKLNVSMADMRKQVIRSFQRNPKPVIDTTITNKMELLSTNSYQKGAWVLHMLRQEVGDKIFWTGIRDFYAAYRDKNAMTADFQAVMEKVSGRQLGDFFKQWLEIPGQPVIEWSWKYDKKKKAIEIDLSQTQAPYIFSFKLPIEIREKAGSNKSSTSIKSSTYIIPVNKKQTLVSLPATFEVGEIRLDPDCQLLFQEKSPEIKK
jgi:aminopeptidase N